MADEADKPVTLATLRRRAEEGPPIAALTCYDATTARWLERAGVDLLLVGDTAAQMILGYPSTVHAPLDFMVTITAAVKRGAPSRFVMADMPFMSYQASDAEAIRNAGRFLTEGFADAVKLEVGEGQTSLVGKLAEAGIPVVAHIGARPQQVHRTGGYRKAGKRPEEPERLGEQAAALEEAGAVMLLLESAEPQVAERTVERVSLPLIGCGAGPACHGHVVVLHDLLGLSDWQPPFAPPQAALGEQLAETARQWVERVRSRRYDGGASPASTSGSDDLTGRA